MIGGLAEVDPGEYARQQMAVGERAGVRSVGPFLEELAARLPRVMAKQMSVVLTHLGGTSHTLRSSIVTVAATLLMRAFTREEDQEESANGMIVWYRRECSETPTHWPVPLCTHIPHRALRLPILQQRPPDCVSSKACSRFW